MGNYISFYSEHNLLAEFKEFHTELYFKSKTEIPEQLVVDLYELHTLTFDNLIPVEKYLLGRHLLTLCKSEAGLFAKEPKSILDFYFACLKKAGKEPYFYGEKEPKFWDGEKWMDEWSGLKLALIGGTYFVGQEFNFKKLEK